MLKAELCKKRIALSITLKWASRPGCPKTQIQVTSRLNTVYKSWFFQDEKTGIKDGE